MKTLWGEKIRIFLATSFFTTLFGMTLSGWLKLLWKHQFGIDPPYWPRAVFITVVSLVNSGFYWHEKRVYGAKLTDLKIKPPLFILGHWRSGTTHLHNLLAVDEQFAYPNLYQTLCPNTFLSAERYFKILGLLAPKTRIVDNVSFGFEEPQEEEFATWNATFLSPYTSWAFPRWEDHYDRYITFRGVPEEGIAEWKAALVLFLKKLTWKYDRPILLKSPSHMCRIKLLLNMFPEARFIHIYRNPYAVFQSTKHLFEFMLRSTCLQHPDLRHIDARIIQRYKTMYDVFFEERELIPDGQFHEVCFEELEKDPMDQLKNIYDKLNLAGFTTVQPSLQRYVDSIANYHKNEYPELSSSLRREITQAWHRSFEKWEYPCE